MLSSSAYAFFRAETWIKKKDEKNVSTKNAYSKWLYIVNLNKFLKVSLHLFWFFVGNCNHKKAPELLNLRQATELVFTANTIQMKKIVLTILFAQMTSLFHSIVPQVWEFFHISNITNTTSYQLRAKHEEISHCLSQNYYVIRLLKTTQPI